MKKIFVFVLVVVCLVTSTAIFTACGNGGLFKKSVSISLDPNGGTVSKRTLVGYPGDEMVLPVPEREGYTFDGWYLGWDPIDNTVFPENNDTNSYVLTARYYAQKDSEQVITYTHDQLNKDYSSWRFMEGEFTQENREKIGYLLHNTNVAIDIKCSFEAHLTNSWFGTPKGTFCLKGATHYAAKELSGWDIISDELSFSSTAAELVNPDNGNRLLYFYASGGMNDSPYFRNFVLTINYIELKGTLV